MVATASTADTSRTIVVREGGSLLLTLVKSNGPAEWHRNFCPKSNEISHIQYNVVLLMMILRLIKPGLPETAQALLLGSTKNTTKKER